MTPLAAYWFIVGHVAVAVLLLKALTSVKR